MVTVTSTFEICSIKHTELIVKDLKKKIQIFVERDKHKYNPEVWRKIKRFKEGEKWELTLESQNELNTEWVIIEVEDV